MLFGKITILGVGLIGGSFALGMKKKGLCREVSGYGRNRDNLARAKQGGIIDSFSSDPAEACRDSELILLSTPVGSFLDLIGRAGPSISEGAIITDAGSVKGDLVYELEKAVPAHARYVGAHPIAGSDRSGSDYADPELFDKARCILTPTRDSDPIAVETVRKVWETLGARVSTMDPGRHDEIYAFVSHLPHLLAYSLVNTVAERDRSYLDFCGNGFRDLTRIAGSSHELWRDVCMLNRKNLLETISLFEKNLGEMRRALEAGDSGGLEEQFRKARLLREGIEKN